MNTYYRVNDGMHSRGKDRTGHVESLSNSISLLFDRYHALLQANPDLFPLPEGFSNRGNELLTLEIMLSRLLSKHRGRNNGRSRQFHELLTRVKGLSGGSIELCKRVIEQFNGIKKLSNRNKKHSGRLNRLYGRFKRLYETFSTGSGCFSTLCTIFSTLCGTFPTQYRTFSTLYGTCRKLRGCFSTLCGTFSTVSGRSKSFYRKGQEYPTKKKEAYHTGRSINNLLAIQLENAQISTKKINIWRFKMSFKKSRLDDFFQNSRDALTNAQNNVPFRTLLANQNVDDARFLEGFTLLDRAADFERNQKVLHLEKKKAYRDMRALLDETQKVLAKHVRFARLCYRKTPGKLLLLGISGEMERKGNLNAWLTQAKFFYSHSIADTDLHPLFLRNGITLTELQDIERKVSEVEQDNRAYREKVGEAQTGVTDRNRAIKDFEYWLSEFIAVCRVAAADQPQMLEILKILVYSAGYKKRPKEKTPAEPGEEPVETPPTQRGKPGKRAAAKS